MTEKVVVLGYGEIGKCIVHELSLDTEYELYVVDKNEIVSGLPKYSKYFQYDIVKELNEFELFIKDKFCVISCLPWFLTAKIAEICCKNNINYLDLTEDLLDRDSIKEFVQKYKPKSSIIPNCGLAPGVVSIITRNLIDKFKEIDEVKIRVGALPLFPSNTLNYSVNWNIQGLLNEYDRPSKIIKNKSKKIVASLDGLEKIVIDGMEYEAFYTSGGAGTLCENEEILHKVWDLDYKSLRYPGHNYLMKFLMKDLFLDKETLENSIVNLCPSNKNDVVIISISVVGVDYVGKKEEINYFNKIVSKSKSYSAVQLATTRSICSVLDLVRKRKVDIGYVQQEEISFTDFLNTSYGGIYKE